MAKTFYVYVIENASQELYVGVTLDLAQRLIYHRDGQCFITKYRRKDLDWHIVHSWLLNNPMDALKFEQLLKEDEWPRVLDLIADCPLWGSYLTNLIKDVKITQNNFLHHKRLGWF